MYINRIIRIFGLLILFFSITMIPPIFTGLIYQDIATNIFIKIFLYTIIIGSFLWLFNLKKEFKFKIRDNFIIVTLFWIIFGSMSALPFILNKYPKINVTDAFFESFSGLTTTGATILTSLNLLPHSILLYRQLLQWIGGMGIVLLIIAIFPFLKININQLYKTEISSLIKNNKIKPRISETAKILSLIYLSLTIFCSFMLWIVGMTPFDAISHSFSIISMGGFSTHDENLNYYNNILINFTIIFFLILSSCNYILHYKVINKLNIKIYWKDIEFRIFIILQFTVILITLIILKYYNFYNSLFKIINFGIFQTISITTTAGFYLDDIYKWPLFLPILIFSLSFIGGCSGSTSGGIKIIRITVFYLQSLREFKKLIHPNLVHKIKLGNLLFKKNKLEIIWSFISIYIFTFFSGVILLISTGINSFFAFISVASALNNLGLGMGQISDNFSSINTTAKWILIVLMLLGRLEIFTFLIIFTSYFWKY